MKRLLVIVAAAACLLLACGPQRLVGTFDYEGRRGDTLSALGARLAGGDGARLTKELAAATGRDASQPFAAGERIPLPYDALKKKKPALAALEFVTAARAAAARGDYAAALASLTQANALIAGDPALTFELGRWQLRAGDHAGAAATLARAAALAPDDEDIATSHATALLAAGRGDEAIAAWDAWRGGHPDFKAGPFVAGELAFARGDWPAARHQYFLYLAAELNGAMAARAREAIKETARREMEAAIEAERIAAAEKDKKNNKKKPPSVEPAPEPARASGEGAANGGEETP